MIAGKVPVVSSDKVFRRIKDVVDLYYISRVFEFDKENKKFLKRVAAYLTTLLDSSIKQMN